MEELKNVLEDTKCIQIGFVVRDLEETKKRVAAFLNVPVPPTKESGDYETVHTVYKGEPAPSTKCKMAFFDLGGIQVEYIEPVENCPSVWTDFLEEKGEGIHHIAFPAKDIPSLTEKFELNGIPMMQKGEYRGQNGRYAYFDGTGVIKTFFELLESY